MRTFTVQYDIQIEGIKGLYFIKRVHIAIKAVVQYKTISYLHIHKIGSHISFKKIERIKCLICSNLPDSVLQTLN